MASLEYRRAATQQASVVGLVIALHDTLIGNLKRAAEAIDRKDVQGRCDQLVHGFKVLQQLEFMLDMQNGGETAIKVRRFYMHVRGQMLAAQFKLSSKLLSDQVKIVLEVREAWQQLDSSPVERPAAAAAPRPVTKPTHTMDAAGQLAAQAAQAAQEQVSASEARLPFSCSV